jgi:N6-L-threonylcarbamoyladenine synthase
MEIASSMLVCVKDIFIQKIAYALQLHPNVKAVAFVGGVACNKYLKKMIHDFCARKNVAFFTPSAQYCTDNAAMIAFVANYKAQQGFFDDQTLDVLT